MLGALLTTTIAQAALSRADMPPAERRVFHLYADEFQSFATESFALILSEARKYGLTLTVAHQYLDQLPDQLRAAVFGNVGSMIACRTGASDAPILAEQIGLGGADALLDLPNFTAWARLLTRRRADLADPPRPLTRPTPARRSSPHRLIDDKPHALRPAARAKSRSASARFSPPEFPARGYAYGCAYTCAYDDAYRRIARRHMARAEFAAPFQSVDDFCRAPTSGRDWSMFWLLC